MQVLSCCTRVVPAPSNAASNGTKTNRCEIQTEKHRNRSLRVNQPARNALQQQVLQVSLWNKYSRLTSLKISDELYSITHLHPLEQISGSIFSTTMVECKHRATRVIADQDVAVNTSLGLAHTAPPVTSWKLSWREKKRSKPLKPTLVWSRC